MNKMVYHNTTHLAMYLVLYHLDIWRNALTNGCSFYEMFGVEGRIITIDAMGTQAEKN